MKNIDTKLEKLVFNSRWLLAPFFVGLVWALIILLGKFVKELFSLTFGFFSSTKSESIISILTLLDTTLIACLMIIIVFSGYEIFVSKIEVDDTERPAWMGKISFTDLKLKLITAIVAISSVELLRAIINVENNSNEVMGWKVGVHLTLLVTAIIFALTDYVVSKKSHGH